MARYDSIPWKTWKHDPSIDYQLDRGMLRIRFTVDDGILRESIWMALIGGNDDATIRQLLREMGRDVTSKEGAPS